MQAFLNWNNIPGLVKSNTLLPGSAYSSNEYSGTDTRDTYLANLKTQPDNWVYRRKPINYFLNKSGYRAPEFADINWAESVVIFGCSNVFGVGVDGTDTVSHQLSLLLNRDVINLGVGGSSMSFSLHNSALLNAGYPTPKAVVQLWTGYDRTVYYHRNRIEHYGSWNLAPHNYMDAWTTDSGHAETHGILTALMAKQIWQDKTPYYAASFFTDTAQLIGCDYLTAPDQGKARDMIHHGPITMQRTAFQIAERLKL